MRQGGEKLGKVLQSLLEVADVGVNLLDIESQALEGIKQAGGTPSFQTVDGYKWATCLCVNEVVVHGIPHDYLLKAGDVITIDIGMLYEGFHSDTAWTKRLGDYEETDEIGSFLAIGEKAFWAAIDQARDGNRVGHISQKIEEHVEGAGYSVVASLVGHGIGRMLHEDPQIPGIVTKKIAATPLLRKGMTIAIEVIYAMGKGAVINKNHDGWTLQTKDGSLTAVYEHTIEVTDRKPRILTRRDG